MIKVYLAHPVTDYGTERQRRAVELLQHFGFAIENPDQPHHHAAYQKHGMEHFVQVVLDCDGLAFLRFPNGSIGAGVAKEIETALRCGLRVWDLSEGTLHHIGTMMPGPILSVEETKSLLVAIRSEAAS